MSYSTEHTALDRPGPAARADFGGAAGVPSTAANVSVVIPCLNEERYIGKVLESLARQYEAGRYEIIVVDGMSTDDTRGVIAEFAARHAGVRVRVVDNPARHIPKALNLGIEHADGDLIMRMDAHSVPSANYVRRCAELLSGTKASVVGMPWRIRPGADSAVARAIALAVAHPFGIGDARYRLTGSPAQFVDTVPFGAFRKSLWEEVGGFNESLLANEDYDFNYRIRRRGGLILLDTSAHSEYFARPRLQDLARQYLRYGRWKAQMLKLHPRSVRWRHLVAPAFVSCLVLLGALSWWWWPARWLLSAVVGTYALAALFFAFRLARGGGRALVPLIAIVFFVLHSTWGGGFLLGLLPSTRRDE